MKHPPTRIVRAFRRAARLRAQGVGWERVAEILRRKVETIEEWPDDYPEYWDMVYARQDRHAHIESLAESRKYLRIQLRDQNAKICQGAARGLGAMPEPPTIPDCSNRDSDLHRFVDEMEGLSHEEHRKLLDEDIARHLRRTQDQHADLHEPGCT
jgi:hypothetical protein